MTETEKKPFVVYGVPTYTQFEHCRKAVTDIINTSTLVPDLVMIVDNSGGEGAEALTDLAQTYSDRVHIFIRRENILSGAWNDLMTLPVPADYTIIANDDVFPHPQSIKALVDAAIAQPSVAMWNGSGHSGNSYSFYLLQKWAFERVGPFDENFKPAYFEDNDFDWRLKCAHLIREEVSLATFDHIGSATTKGMKDQRIVNHHASFVQNQRYYKRKWGALPGNEQFTIPFEKPWIFDLADL